MQNGKYIPVTVTEREKWMGIAYLPFEFYIIPRLLGYLNGFLNLSDTVLNIAFFWVNFVAILLIFNRYLWRSLRMVAGHFWDSVQAAILGAVAYFACSWLISVVTLYLNKDFVNLNDAGVLGMAGERFGMMAVCTMFLVPVAEETIFRGVLFGGLHNRSRMLAYGVSTVLFAAVHVLGYLGSASWQTLLLCYLQYLPAGIWLAWSYEKSGTVIVPMLVHGFLNAVALYGLR